MKKVFNINKKELTKKLIILTVTLFTSIGLRLPIDAISYKITKTGTNPLVPNSTTNMAQDKKETIDSNILKNTSKSIFENLHNHQKHNILNQQNNNFVNKYFKKENQTGKFIINISHINQKSMGFPTGCESASAVMLLNYKGIKISLDDFINNFLNKSAAPTMINNKLVADSPNNSFIGDPRSYNGYGCYAPVIIKAMKKATSNSLNIINTTGTDIEDLISKYISKNNPVLIWASSEMKDITNGTSWYINGKDEKFTWKKGEHCLVLVGYDNEKYYFNDPLSNGVRGFNKELVQDRFSKLQKQSIVII